MITLKATRISYSNDEDRERYTNRNQEFIQRVNDGEKFYLHSEVVEVWGDDEVHDPYYDLVWLDDFSVLPLPLLVEAAGFPAEWLPSETHLNPLTEMIAEKFGDQFAGYRSRD